MQHHAWLHSSLPKSKKSRYASALETNPDSPILTYPTLSWESYVLQVLVEELGVCQSNGFGPAPQTWQELSAWCNVTGNNLTHWESTIIIHLSRVYVGAYNKYNDTTEPAPYTVETFDRDRVSKSVGSFFRAMATRRVKNG